MLKYIGRTVEIIYLDKQNNITKRQIRVKSMCDGFIKAYCFGSKGPRIFLIANILAVQPVIHHAV